MHGDLKLWPRQASFSFNKSSFALQGIKVKSRFQKLTTGLRAGRLTISSIWGEKRCANHEFSPPLRPSNS